MIQGMYAAANGMMAVEDRQAVIANNIANVTTPGFKRQLAVQQGYYEQFFAGMRTSNSFNLEIAPGGGVKTIQTFTSHADGVITHTGSPLDVALIGPGYLNVETADGQRFTRNGRLSIGPGGDLITGEGHRVLDTGGNPIDVSGGLVEIDGTGVVRVSGAIRGQLAILEFTNRDLLKREGYTLYSAPQSAIDEAVQAETTVVSSGALETSNVQLPSEMADMMLALRAYAANQRVITAIDETMSRLIDQVGAPG